MKSSKYFFNIESRPNKDGTRLVFFNLSYGYNEFNSVSGKSKYIPLRISTKVRVLPKYWDTNLGYLDSKYSLNAGKTKDLLLKKVKSEAEITLENYWRENDFSDPKPSVLKQLVEIRLKRKQIVAQSLPIQEFIDELIQQNSKVTPTQKSKLSDKQTDKYNTIKNQIEEFGKSRNTVFTLSNFSNDRFYEYLNFINDNRKQNPCYPNGYLVNGISKNANTLLALLGKARDAGYEIAINLNDSNLRIEEVKSVDAEVYLSEDDLRKIIDANTAKSKEFENARNFFIICSLTSLRYEDMSCLHELELERVKGKKHEFVGFLTKLRKPSNQKKKDIFTFIPAFELVRDIVEQNGGKFPKFPCNQVMNTQLKKFALYVGLDKQYTLKLQYYGMDKPIEQVVPLYERVKCHMGRSTFITNISKLGVVDTAIEHITHPTTPKGIISTVYNKSSLIDRAELFLDSLKAANPSDIYKL
jgi:hypothetical protein